MSRVIKFRAWNRAENKMYENVGIYPRDKGCTFDREGDILDMYGSQPAIMQFTGLTDRLGKEIYDGDILRVRGPFEELRVSVLWGPVINMYTWMNGETWLARFPSGVEAPLYPYCKYHHGDDVEIIGNIYENPELMEKR